MTPHPCPRATTAARAARAFLLAALLLLPLLPLTGCGGTQSGANHAAPPSDEELVRVHRKRIEQLREAARPQSPITTQQDNGEATGTTASDPDGGGDSAAAEPTAPRPAEDGADVDRCAALCEPADAICESAGVICEVASFNPDLAGYRGDCEWALDACSEARSGCKACQ